MIAACPQCQSRYRIARDKIAPRGSRLRCSKCSCVFCVQLPPEAALPADEVSPAHALRALVVEPDQRVAATLCEALEGFGFVPESIAEAGEALLRVFRKPPDVLVLGGHLSGLPARAFAEIVRRSPLHRGLRMVRLAALDEPPGAPEFEADATLEPSAAGHALARALVKLGFAAPVPPAPAPVPEAPVAPAPAAVDEVDDDLRAEIEAAERLARIIVSDIILYNEEKFAQAVGKGNLQGTLRPELDEGMALFRQRVPERVRAQREFVLDELRRRADSLDA